MSKQTRRLPKFKNEAEERAFWESKGSDSTEYRYWARPQPDVSRLLNGQFRDLSVERLMRLLTRLGCDVDITIRRHGQAAAARDTIRLSAASV